MIVGTAGHIDHGKTALVRALTGVNTDRLPEEKARGISIDLGFAYRPLPDGDVLGFVDVPGHVRFIHNMLAGAAGVDFVLLVIAADDGPMPQTGEHLAIIELLGIRRGLIALTKCDLVDARRRAAAIAEVEELTAGTPFASAEIVPVSSITREGLDGLESRLLAEAVVATRHRVGGGFRMAVDRRFALTGAGTVVTGTVFAGEVAIGDNVIVTPSGLNARVRGLHANNAQAARAKAGQRCAINLSGTDVSLERIQRGDWIVTPALHAPTDRIDVQLQLLTSASRPLSHWSSMHLHIGTAHVAAHVALLGDAPITPGAMGLAQLVTDRPIAALAGDRLVLRQPSARQTVAGGIVLDPWPPNRGRRRPERQLVLAALAAPTVEGAMEGLIRSEPGWFASDRYCRATNLTPEEAAAAISHITARNLAVQAGSFLVSKAVWDELRHAILDALDKHHTGQPDAQGLEMGRLRLALPKRYPLELVAGAADLLRREGLVGRSGPWWHRQGHSAHLSGADQNMWKRIQPSLAKLPFSPPRVRDLADALEIKEDIVRSLLRRLARVGTVIEVANDHFYLRPAVAALAALAHQTAAEHSDVLATNEFRDRIVTGRKVAIQILEFFDKSGVTTRRGEARIVRKEKLALFGPSIV